MDLNRAAEKRMEGVKQRRILAAVDESEESMYALKWSLDTLNFTSNDTLILYHVKRLPSHYEGLGAPGFVLTPEVVLSVQKYHDRIADEVMRRALDVCKGSQVNLESKIEAGDARDAICSAVKTFQVDILVIGSHGYGAVKRTFLGSVSDYCAHHAKCPVMIVKKPRV